MTRKFIKAWLSCWLYVLALISGVILGITALRWPAWDLQTKLFALATALLPLHVLEEWRFPGGFHTMYNLMAKSDAPESYPMNQLSDMWTNLIGVIFGCVALILGVTPLFAVMQLLLCFAEIYGHTSGGIFSYRRFKSKGKRTIYNPGLGTALTGYLPIAAGLVVSFFRGQAPTALEAVLAVGLAAALGTLSLPVMEGLCKDRNTPYGYGWGNGYFSRYTGGSQGKP